MALFCLLFGGSAGKAEEDPQYKQAYDSALQLGQAGRYAEAVARMQQACAIDPSQFFAFYNLGVLSPTC